MYHAYQWCTVYSRCSRVKVNHSYFLKATLPVILRQGDRIQHTKSVFDFGKAGPGSLSPVFHDYIDLMVLATVISTGSYNFMLNAGLL